MLERMLLQGHNQQLQQALRLDEEIAGELKAQELRRVCLGRRVHSFQAVTPYSFPTTMTWCL
jgi:hypothetical protein